MTQPVRYNGSQEPLTSSISIMIMFGVEAFTGVADTHPYVKKEIIVKLLMNVSIAARVI